MVMELEGEVESLISRGRRRPGKKLERRWTFMCRDNQHKKVEKRYSLKNFNRSFNDLFKVDEEEQENEEVCY